MSKFIKVLFALMVLNFCASLFAAELNENSSVSENSVIGNSSSVSMIDESTISLGTTEISETRATSSGNSFFLVLRMIVFLAIVITLIYGVLWFMKKNMATENVEDQFLRQVASINVAPGKSVQVITLLDKKAFVIGVGDDGINLLSEFESPDAKPSDYKELIDAMNLYADTKRNTKKPRSFSDVLEIFMPNGPKDTGVFVESNSKISDLLKKQRNRLNGGE